MKAQIKAHLHIAGVDEAGRGPLAGPVVAGAVILPKDYQDDLIDDSKKLSAQLREFLYEKIIKDAIAWSVVAVGHRRIDALNIREASRLAMRLAVERVHADKVLVDGNVPIDVRIPQELIIGGDASVLCISAASIIAKVWRDRLMTKLALKYPGYGLEVHAGYPTAAHRAAIIAQGPSRIHRKTFRGVKQTEPSVAGDQESNKEAEAA